MKSWRTTLFGTLGGICGILSQCYPNTTVGISFTVLAYVFGMIVKGLVSRDNVVSSEELGIKKTS